MTTDAEAARIEEARHLLARYLSDEIAPMIFASAADDLFKAPPELVAREIRGWITIQLQGANPSEICDYLLHSAKKVHHLGELELLPFTELKGYLEQLKPILLSLCPERDRPRLAANLGRLEARSQVMAAQISVGRSPAAHGAGAGIDAEIAESAAASGSASAGSAGAGGEATGQRRRASDLGALPDLPAAEAPEAPPHARRADDAPSAQPDPTGAHIERLNLLLDRWERLASRRGVGAGTAAGTSGNLSVSLAGAESALLSRIIDEVATTSRSSSDLDNQLRMLGGFGIDGLGSGVFRTLSSALPDWAPSRPPADADPQLPGPARTMRRLVGLAEDPAELHRRFTELVSTAVEEFNKGSLGRAVTVLDLAQRMVAEKQVDASAAANIIDEAGAKLDEAQLKKFSDNEDRHALLGRVLDVFPSLSPDSLIEALSVEERRERRRLILRLLAVHGEDARQHAIRLLRESVSGNVAVPWFVQRNLIYLMRTIPPGEEADADKEIDLLVRASVPGGELPLIREALTALGQLDHPRAVQTLTARVSDLEDVLAQKGRSIHNPTEIQSLLDTAVKALVRFSSKEARRCVLTHGLKKRPELGNTTARLAMLGTQHLGDDPATVNRIAEAIKEELPMKVFGVSMKSSRKTQTLEALIDSLSGTDTPQVRRILDGVVRNFPGERFANAAAKALTKLGTKSTADASAVDEPTVTSLSGDLSLFGLPNLMQNLADSRVEGVLTVLDDAGNATATISLRDGMMVDTTAGNLSGETAVYQLLERPITGRFIFVNQPVATGEGGAEPAGRAVMSLLMEGMRRYDEFNRAASIIPDDGRFAATGRQPSGLPDEDNADFVNGIWVQATQGHTPLEVEAEAAVDSYRVFRLYEHWVNEGSLKAREDASS